MLPIVFFIDRLDLVFDFGNICDSAAVATAPPRLHRRPRLVCAYEEGLVEHTCYFPLGGR